MPLKSFLFYCVVFALGAGLCVYVVWWRRTWFDAGLAVAATTLVLFPLFAGREFRFVRLMQAEHRSDLLAQKISGNEVLRLAREKDAERNAALIDTWNREYARLLDEHESLLRRVPARARDGRFVKASTSLRRRDHIDLDDSETRRDHPQPHGGPLAEIEDAALHVGAPVEHRHTHRKPVGEV